MVAFDKWVADATAVGAEQKKKKARPRVHVREAIERVAEDGTLDMTNDVDVLKAVLAEIGFRSAGFDAMPDDEVETLLSRASTIRQLLRAWRKNNPTVDPAAADATTSEEGAE